MSNEKRSGVDRRSTADGRRLFVPTSPFYTGSERRNFQDRRAQPERRKGWVRISEWSSKPTLEPDERKGRTGF
jgi:hypothetical protein